MSDDPGTILSDIARRLRAGALLPYLGCGMAELACATVPTTPRALAEALGGKVALPKRARGNCWAAAQFIESHRHRATLDALMSQIYATPVAPSPLHRLLAGLAPPLIVDTWYDDAMHAALSERRDWAEMQGISRARPGEARWFRAYDAAGQPCALATAETAPILLYKPHGGAVPAGNFLITDADYVEVLTEIDIQTPIPDAVKQRRRDRGFLFLGCRFDDQVLRTFARQILKYSSGPHYAVLEAADLTRNEHRLLDELGMTVLPGPLGAFAEALPASG
jgi:hypothetical protein